MRTSVSSRRPSFGMECVQCSNELVAPERSEHWSDRRLSYLVLPEMQLLFRVARLVSCRRQVDELRHLPSSSARAL
jgi:hypothetical protein